jgi:hypothetical protein
MKLFVILINVFIFKPACGQVGKEVLRYYLKQVDKADTFYYCSVTKNDKGFSFVFPEITAQYYKLKDSATMTFDTIIQKRTSVFGPYVFLKKENKILFKDLNKSKKYHDLYSIADSEFLAPDLFSSSTNSYSILTKLLDSNTVLQAGSRNISCFRYLQAMEYHYNKEYRVIYIDKRSLLPYKFEYYVSKDLKNMSREIFTVID